MQKIVLASQSPRRKQLLEWAEVPFEIVVQDTDESYPGHLSLEEIPIHIARQKAFAVQQMIAQQQKYSHLATLPLLAADTVVVFNNEIIGKPADRQQAIDILHKLSGQQHEVITGVIISHNNTEVAFHETTEVAFHPLTTGQIEFYVDEYKPYDKAGAYAIQEWIGVVGIRYIKGDFYNVMGLPVSRVVQELGR